MTEQIKVISTGKALDAAKSISRRRVFANGTAPGTRVEFVVLEDGVEVMRDEWVARAKPKCAAFWRAKLFVTDDAEPAREVVEEVL